MRILTLDRMRFVALIMMLASFTFKFMDNIGVSIHPIGHAIEHMISIILWPLIFTTAGALVREKVVGASPVKELKRYIFVLLIPYMCAAVVLKYGKVAFAGSEFFDLFKSFGNSVFGDWSGSYLGILGILAVIMILTSPLMLLLSKTGFYDELQRMTDRNIWLFTPIVDLWLSDMVLSSQYLWGARTFGGANILMLSVAFLYGHYYYGDPEIISKFKDFRRKAAFAGTVSLVMLVWLEQQSVIGYGFNRHYMAYALLRSVAIWCTMIGIGSALHRPMVMDKVVRNVSPYALWIYILYLPVCLVVLMGIRCF